MDESNLHVLMYDEVQQLLHTYSKPLHRRACMTFRLNLNRFVLINLEAEGTGEDSCPGEVIVTAITVVLLEVGTLAAESAGAVPQWSAETY